MFIRSSILKIGKGSSLTRRRFGDFKQEESMKAVDSYSILGRKPKLSATSFDVQTEVAAIEQLVRAEYLVNMGILEGKQVTDVGCEHGYTTRFFHENGRA